MGDSNRNESDFARRHARRWVRLGVAVVAAAVPSFVGAQDAPLDQPAHQLLIAPAAVPLFAVAPVVPASLDHDRALDCMTMAIAYEAGNQPIAGQQAVGQVILNRVRGPRFPKSVCGVVFDGSARVTGCQFTFTCDGSIRRRLRDVTLQTARDVAESVLSGAAPDRVAGATNYHADYVTPYWATTGTRIAKIGAHIFYRMPGDGAWLGQSTAFSGVEPVIAPVAHYGARRAARSGRVVTAAVAVRPMFAPWGLPVAAASQP